MKLTRVELAERYGVTPQAISKALAASRDGRQPPTSDGGRPARFDRAAADLWWGYDSQSGGHGASSYRAGCRCAECRAAHAAEAQGRRHRQVYGDGAPMGPAVREQLLADLRAGHTVMRAAERAGVTYQRVYTAAQALPEFGEQLRALS